MWNTSFSNKTQLKIFFFYWIGPGSMYFYSFEPGPISTVHVNSGEWIKFILHCSLKWTVESSLSTGEERRQEQEKNAGEADKTYFS